MTDKSDKSASAHQVPVDWQDKYARAMADYQNLVRQHQKDRLDYVRFANQTLIAQLLPVLDSLELAAKHGTDPGINMITKQLKSLMETQGVIFISPQVGETFDPQIHECIEIDPSPDQEPETIAKLVQSGARWQDSQVIRPAHVVVYRTDNSQSKTPVDSN